MSKQPRLFSTCLGALLLMTGAMTARGDEPAPAYQRAIKQVLDTQAEAWNRGDIDGFMQHYWKSDDLTFSSGGKTTRGWNATRENYRRRYPTAEKMGRVSFRDLEFQALGESAALVLGRWKLDRQKESFGGGFSLVFRRLDGKWLIVHDHTSRDAEP
ncbi:MAG: nuclear transport factor 2 family protein [Pirellulaceae bacterium]